MKILAVSLSIHGIINVARLIVVILMPVPAINASVGIMAWSDAADPRETIRPLYETFYQSNVNWLSKNSQTYARWIWDAVHIIINVPFQFTQLGYSHDVQFSCAINQPLLAHHWKVPQCLLTSRFIAPSIPLGVSAPGGKMLKQLLKDHNFLNNSPIFIIESSTFDIFAFQKALHTIHFNLKSCFGFGERYLTP